jgi:hypothetical protein
VSGCGPLLSGVQNRLRALGHNLLYVTLKYYIIIIFSTISKKKFSRQTIFQRRFQKQQRPAAPATTTGAF